VQQIPRVGFERRSTARALALCNQANHVGLSPAERGGKASTIIPPPPPKNLRANTPGGVRTPFDCQRVSASEYGQARWPLARRSRRHSLRDHPTPSANSRKRTKKKSVG